MLRIKLHPRDFVFFRSQQHLSEEDGKEDISAIDWGGSEFLINAGGRILGSDVS